MMTFAVVSKYCSSCHVFGVLLFVGLAFSAPTDSKFETGASLQQQEASVTFTLFATDMSGCDSATACDLYVKINCASSGTDFQECGRTSKRQDDYNPVWPEVFTFQHVAGTSQRWRFDLMDVDVAFDDLIASVDVDMDEYVNAPGNLFQKPVPGRTGIFWIQRQR